jgi:hypothetical protein
MLTHPEAAHDVRLAAERLVDLAAVEPEAGS